MKRLTARATLIAVVAALAGLGGAGGAWVADRAIGVSPEAPRTVVARVRRENLAGSLLVVAGGLAGGIAGLFAWSTVARRVGLTTRERQAVTRP